MLIQNEHNNFLTKSIVIGKEEEGAGEIKGIEEKTGGFEVNVQRWTQSQSLISLEKVKIYHRG